MMLIDRETRVSMAPRVSGAPLGKEDPMGPQDQPDYLVPEDNRYCVVMTSS